MAKKNANVPGSSREAEICETFSPGDVVRLKVSALTNDDLELKALDLYKIGHPNEFVVAETFEQPRRGLCVALRECCYLFENHATGIKTCKGHDAIYFEKMGKERPKKKGDRIATVTIPWIGELVGFEYQDDEQNPKADFRVAGKKISLEGAPAKLFRDIINGYGLQL